MGAKNPLLFCLLSAFTCLLGACGNNPSDAPVEKHPPIVIKKDIPNKETPTPQNAPIINLSDTVSLACNVLCIKDSAINSQRLSQKLTLIYGEKLQAIVKKNKAKMIGPPMAWYKTQKAPFFFEAGIPIDKKSIKKLPKGVILKHLKSDSAIVAHYFGPYEETNQAYTALKDWMKSKHRQASAPPFEMYVGDPLDKDGKPIDPYKVQTDIVFPHH